MAILSPLRHAQRVAPEAVAVLDGERAFTYGELWERCRRLVGALRGLGLRHGDRVAVVAPNCHRWLELYLAIPGAGCTIVPLAPSLTADALRHAIGDAGARIAFTTAGAHGGVDGLVERTVDLGDEYERLLASAPSAAPPDDLDASAIAGLFYTGGTTGLPKGVMLTHRNLLANARHFRSTLPFDAGTRWLIAAPMFHVSGTIAVLATITGAGSQVLMRTFSPGEALDLAARHRVTGTLLVPAALAELTDEQLARPRDVGRLRDLCHGGAPIAAETIRRAAAAFPDSELLHLYGATEMAPIATALPREQEWLGTQRERSCGRPVAGVRVAIRRSDGSPAVPGEIGEVLISGPNVMAGYWQRPTATAAALVDGWYRTGDLGHADDEGYVQLVDRHDDAIATTAGLVSSLAVEDALHRHPAVAEAAAFAVPDDAAGEAVHATVRPRTAVTVDELLAHCAERLAPHERPLRIDLVRASLPRSAAGKVLKRALREPHWGDRDRADRSR